MNHQFSQLDEKKQSCLTKIAQKQLGEAISNINETITVQAFLTNSYNILENGKPTIVKPKKLKVSKSPTKKPAAKSPKKKTNLNEKFTPEEIKFQNFMKQEIKNRKEEFKGMPYKERLLLLTHEWCVLTDEEKGSIAVKLGKFD